ncbi:MAG TPA: hypothetical protein VJP02_01705 [Candidatus Sulfotelmatobacter sp.]|nr:hypothetical protein [Candidatus Sulfotelmatobacter sp.]
MTALAHSLKRIWSAKNRVPHQTGWGTRGSLPNWNGETTVVGMAYDGVLVLTELARQTSPTILFIVWNIFR